MYHPAVNLMNPAHLVSTNEDTGWGARTGDPKEHSRLAEPTARLVPVLEHLQHRRHLLPAVQRLILDHVQLLAVRRPVYLDDLVSRVRRVRRDNVEP